MQLEVLNLVEVAQDLVVLHCLHRKQVHQEASTQEEEGLVVEVVVIMVTIFLTLFTI